VFSLKLYSHIVKEFRFLRGSVFCLQISILSLPKNKLNTCSLVVNVVNAEQLRFDSSCI